VFCLLTVCLLYPLITHRKNLQMLHMGHAQRIGSPYDDGGFDKEIMIYF
ncbi:16610_t:CDS:1, partial [Acaulospora morrowiae]